MTLGTVCMMLMKKKKPPSWSNVRAVMRKKNFINSVIQFDTKLLPQSIKNSVLQITESSEWDIDKINHASKAAGPLAKWVSSQIHFADILNKVQPMKDEIQ